MIRMSNRDDSTEDLFLAVRELIENFGVAPREIRRLVNLAIKGEPPASIRDRVEPGGSPDLEPVEPLAERPEKGSRAADGAGPVVRDPETVDTWAGT